VAAGKEGTREQGLIDVSHNQKSKAQKATGKITVRETKRSNALWRQTGQKKGSQFWEKYLGKHVRANRSQHGKGFIGLQKKRI